MIRYELSNFWQEIYDYKYIEVKQMTEDTYFDYPRICRTCKYLTYNSDDFEADGEYGFEDEWYTCSCEENSDNEYDLPWGEDSCPFKIEVDDV